MAILIILIIIFWGIWGFFEKLALLSGSPWQTLFAFLFWTAILFLPFTIFMLWKKQGKEGFKIVSPVWMWIFIAVLSDLVAVLALRYSLLSGPTGIVIAVTAVYPIVTAALSIIFLKEKISKWQYVGILIVCVGLFFLSIS
jgi:transporter family protein